MPGAETGVKRVGLTDKDVDKLHAKKILVCRDLFARTEYELINALELSGDQVRDMLLAVSERVAPQPKLASTLLEEQGGGVGGSALPTGLRSLDEALRGGLPCGALAEVVGPSGVGKSTLCLTAACLTVIDPKYGGLGGSVAYIDTEGKFSAQRMLEVISKRLSCTDDDLSSAISRCHIIPCTSAANLQTFLYSMDEFIIENRVKLVVVDSVAALVRREFDRKSLVHRQEFLSRQASQLKNLAESFRIPVLVTNQVTSAGGGGGGAMTRDDRDVVTAALGNTWAHCVNTRLAMEEHAQCGRRMTIAKSPLSPVCHFSYEITHAGIQLTSEAILDENNFWSAQIGVAATDLGDA